jgi:hypothetical protein
MMKPADFIVRIPEPCHEDWNTMQPDAKGKFCSSCSKSVFDFTNKTDVEIKSTLIEHKEEKVCGHFKKTQIDRPLNMTLDLSNLPKNISITKTFALALFIVFGSLLFSCKDEKGNEIPLKGMPEMLAGLTFIDIPPPIETDSSVCLITGEVPSDATETVYMTQDILGGAVSIDPEYFVEPSTLPVAPPPVEMLLGAMTYSVFEPDDTVEPLQTDSTLNESKRIIADQSKAFSVYPNPTSGEFTIKYDLLKRTDVKISIFDMSGSLVKPVVNVSSQYEGLYRVPVNLNDLSNGIYIVNMIHNGTQSTERLVIAR